MKITNNIYMLAFVALFGMIILVGVFWIIREWFTLYTEQIFEITLTQLLELPVGDILMAACWFNDTSKQTITEEK